MQFLNKFSRRQIVWSVVVILFVATLALWVAAFSATPRGVLTFAVMDVGQGDSIYIESPTGVQVVIDGGPDSSLLHELPKIMPYGDRTIDAVIATHPDADHIAGLVDLISRYHVGAFIEPGVSKPTATAKTLEREVAALKIPHYLARRGMILDLGGGVLLYILFPDRDVSNLSSNKVNEGGVVVRLVYGQSSALLMADVPSSIENYLVELDASGLQSEILKVGHHGSKNSTGELFVSTVSPQVAIISVGAKNRYGHPTAEVLNRLTEHGIHIMRTDQRGTIRCTSNSIRFSCN